MNEACVKGKFGCPEYILLPVELVCLILCGIVQKLTASYRWNRAPVYDEPMMQCYIAEEDIEAMLYASINGLSRRVILVLAALLLLTLVFCLLGKRRKCDIGCEGVVIRARFGNENVIDFSAIQFVKAEKRTLFLNTARRNYRIRGLKNADALYGALCNVLC